MSDNNYNVARFDLVSLRLALACARLGTLTLAARESNLALAAASRRLRELEANMGAPIFERHAQGLALTAFGRVCLDHAEAVLAALDLMAAACRDHGRGVVRHIRLASGTAGLNQFLPPLLAKWDLARPTVRIELNEEVSARVAQSVRERRADLGILVEGVDLGGLHSRLFRHDELVLLVPPRHRLARGRGLLNFADLLDEDWIGLMHGAAVLMRQQQAAVAAGGSLKLRMQVQSFDAACRLVAEGLGLALLPRAAVAPLAHFLGVPIRRLSDSWCTRNMQVVWRLDVPDKLVEEVVDFLCLDAQASKPSRAAKTS